MEEALRNLQQLAETGDLNAAELLVKKRHELCHDFDYRNPVLIDLYRAILLYGQLYLGEFLPRLNQALNDEIPNSPFGPFEVYRTATHSGLEAEVRYGYAMSQTWWAELDEKLQPPSKSSNFNNLMLTFNTKTWQIKLVINDFGKSDKVYNWLGRDIVRYRELRQYNLKTLPTTWNSNVEYLTNIHHLRTLFINAVAKVDDRIHAIFHDSKPNDPRNIGRPIA